MTIEELATEDVATLEAFRLSIREVGHEISELAQKCNEEHDRLAHRIHNIDTRIANMSNGP